MSAVTRNYMLRSMGIGVRGITDKSERAEA